MSTEESSVDDGSDHGNRPDPDELDRIRNIITEHAIAGNPVRHLTTQWVALCSVGNMQPSVPQLMR